MNLKSILPEIEWAADLILRGRLVAFPTETVYGLGAHALDPRAVAGIFEAKQRPRFDPLIVHIAGPETLQEVAARCSRKAEKLVERFWPGPLTLVLPKSAAVPGIVTAGLPTVAVRMPNHPMALELIRTAGVPIAAPSANRFGCLSPTTAAHVREQLGNRVDYILDGGPCAVGVESTILALTDEPPMLLRPGGLPIEEIESVIGPVTMDRESLDPPRAPGQLPSHYAPRTPLMILDEKTPPPISLRDVGLLCFRTPRRDVPASHVEILSRSGDLREAAGNLFAALHRLDERELDVIYAEPVPETGLGRAIMNRLGKASVRIPSDTERPVS